MTKSSPEHRSQGQLGLTKALLTLHINETKCAQPCTAAKLVGTTPSTVATMLLAQARDQVPQQQRQTTQSKDNTTQYSRFVGRRGSH